MNPQDHILNRLQRHVSQIARMVAPGSTHLQTIQGAWNLSPIASNFGGRKFQRAAQAMRVLTRANPLEARAEKANTMAHTIQAKFQNVQKLLHVSVAGSGFWPEVEQVFPNQASTE